MFTETEKEEIRDFLSQTEGRIYIGCDSAVNKRFNLRLQRYENWARFAVVLVVHIDDCHGCRIFKYMESERVYDTRPNKPSQRLMTEVYKSVDCFLALGDMLEDREVEIHLDVNSDESHASHSIARQAIGYVKGVTNLDALIKPDAWAGSNTADRMVRYRSATN